MMLDSGASPNLIKRKYVKSTSIINSKDIIELHGIADVPLFTLGSVRLVLFGKEAVCHIVPDEMAIPHAGLVEIDNVKHPLKTNRIEDGVMYIPPRNESTFFIKVKNPELKEGYLPRVKICKGVFTGNCLVRVSNGRAYMQILTQLNDEVGIKIPILAIREVEEAYAPRTIDPENSYENLIENLGVTKRIFTVVKNQFDECRFEKLKPLINLDYLEKIERIHVEKFIKKIFRLFPHPW
ncbi:hypothetical protein KQX54_015356 [Cotesia glomerata]|uniref:Peptidase A2 domain-containing protein n=1 Tax=Cotesia glomerata TaxID=32391 RepID=A0AAV7IYU2_COTGL|nr:hypothetical protein KQX54_015356 [Cotesia glomerata]